MDYPEKNFDCQLCGECCSGEMRVFVNPHDLEKIRRYLKLPDNQSLLDQGYICLDQGQNGLQWPRLRFKKSGKLQFCPFLENRIDDKGDYRGLCQLHPDKKPLVCALAPFARELDLEKKSERFYFQKPVDNCPGCDVSKRYLLSDLFPQVEKELISETHSYQQIKGLLDQGASNQQILKEVFALTPKTD